MRGTEVEADERGALAKPAKIAVVIPAYRVERHIRAVIEGLPPIVSLIVVVNDASPDQTVARVREVDDPRVVLVEHERNQGVGGAMVSGYRECLRRGADIVIKVDGDGQMDPRFLPALIQPLLVGTADFTKGNPLARCCAGEHAGPTADGQPGSVVLDQASQRLLEDIRSVQRLYGHSGHGAGPVALQRLARDYFFETSVLVELYILRRRAGRAYAGHLWR